MLRMKSARNSCQPKLAQTLRGIRIALHQISGRFAINNMDPSKSAAASERSCRLASLKDRKLLTCSEVAFLYRKDAKEVSASYHAGKIPGRADGRAIYVSAKHAEILWGAKWARAGSA